MTSTALVTMPDKATAFIREIERLGLKYQFVPQYDLSQLDLEKKRIQVREVNHYSPPASIKQFAQAMKGGVVFPPIVVTADGYTADGTTRIEAARKNGMPTFPALVVTTAYEKASAEARDKFTALGATLNQINGIRLTVAELKVAAIALLRLNWNMPNIQRALGLNPGIVYKIGREQAALERLGKVGIKTLPEAYLNLAGSKQMLALNDEPYKRLVLLMADANLGSTEAKKLADEVKATGSDEAAIDLIKKYRAEYEQRITEHALTGEGKPSLGAKFRQALGRLLSYEGTEVNAVEHADSMREEHTLQIERAIVVLQNVLAHQEASDDA